MKRFAQLTTTLAIGLALVACNKSDSDAGKTTAAKKKAEVAAKKAAPVKLEAPAEVLLYGGSNAIEPSLKKISALAGQVMPQVPDLTQMIGPSLQQEWKLTKHDVTDLTKSIRFAVLDPKAFKPAPIVLLVPMKSKDAFVAALPQHNQKKDDAGNAISYTKSATAKRPVFVNFIGDHAVFTRNGEAFNKIKPFLNVLATAPMPAEGAVYVEVDHALAIFGQEFDQSFEKAKKEITKSSTAGTSPEQLKMVGTMVDWMGRSVRDIDLITATLITPKDGLKLDIRVSPKSGSKLAKTMALLEGTGKTNLLGKLPEDTSFFTAIAVNSDKVAQMSAEMMNKMIIGALFGDDTAKAKPYSDAMTAYMKALDGEFILAAHGTDGLNLTGLFGLKDGATARKSQRILAGLYTGENTELYKEKMGASMTFKQEAYKVGEIPVDIITTNLNSLPPAAAQMAGVFSDLMTQHIAIGDKIGVLAYGKAGKKDVQGFLGGSIKGGLTGTSGVKRALNHAATNFSFLMYINPIELAKRIKLGGMNPLAAMLQGIGAKTGIGLSLGVTDGTAQFVIDVPIELAKQGIAAFEKTKGAF